ncbi:hypothetical protein OY671_012399, partial [Metschnikowia pulcherrima]
GAAKSIDRTSNPSSAVRPTVIATATICSVLMGASDRVSRGSVLIRRFSVIAVRWKRPAGDDRTGSGRIGPGRGAPGEPLAPRANRWCLGRQPGPEAFHSQNGARVWP